VCYCVLQCGAVCYSVLLQGEYVSPEAVGGALSVLQCVAVSLHTWKGPPGAVGPCKSHRNESCHTYE